MIFDKLNENVIKKIKKNKKNFIYQRKCINVYILKHEFINNKNAYIYIDTKTCTHDFINNKNAIFNFAHSIMPRTISNTLNTRKTCKIKKKNTITNSIGKKESFIVLIKIVQIQKHLKEKTKLSTTS